MVANNEMDDSATWSRIHAACLSQTTRLSRPQLHAASKVGSVVGRGMDESIFKRREGQGAPSPEPRCLKRSFGRMMTKKRKTYTAGNMEYVSQK